MTHSEDRDETLKRLISRHLDGRLDAAGEQELADGLVTADEARDYRQSLSWAREVMRTEAPPALPAGLEQRILQRVARTRSAERGAGDVLRLARRLALAAAVVLGVALFALNRAPQHDVVNAGNRQPPTVEDALRQGTDGEGSLVRFLRAHFLGEAR